MYLTSVKTAKKSGSSANKRRKYDEAFQAEAPRLASESRSTQTAAQQLGIRPKLLYRWQQAQLVAEVGSVEVARDPEVRALRARLKRSSELDMLKSLGHFRPPDLTRYPTALFLRMEGRRA
ncbi:MAG TPA: transposase [Hymenobacter sp.]